MPLGRVAAIAAETLVLGGNVAARFAARTLREDWFRRAHLLTTGRVFVQAPCLHGFSNEILRNYDTALFIMYYDGPMLERHLLGGINDPPRKPR